MKNEVRHGVYVTGRKPSPSVPTAAESGIPFVIGCAPIQSASAPAKAGVPVICESWDDVVKKLGYSDDWESYSLCEFADSHFRLYGCKPVAFCNLLDPASMTESVRAEDMAVTDHQVKLPISAISNETLVIKASGGDPTYNLGTDYQTAYVGEHLIVSLLEGGKCYSASTLNVAYTKVTPAKVTAESVAAAVEKAELCMAATGFAPDLLCAPGYSSDPAVAAALALKASGINGMFKAVALIDIDCGPEGATDQEAAIAKKAEGSLTDPTQILCWPMIKKGDRIYHMSTHLAGVMARTDASHDGCPYESPSNKLIEGDAIVLADGTDVMLSMPQATGLNANGIVTALSYLGEIRCWGNYTAAYPASTRVEEIFVPNSRTCAWVGNSLIRTLWDRLDTPINRRLIDSLVDAANIWLNGLVGSGYLLGARVEIPQDENPEENLLRGIVKLHVYIASPTPAQEIQVMLEFDAAYIAAAMR